MSDDEILRTIYKMEIEPSSYLQGVDKMVASTNQLSKSQESYNDTGSELISTLAEIKEAHTSLSKEAVKTRRELKENEQQIAKTTKALESASGEIKNRLIKNLGTLNESNAILKTNLQQVNEELVVTRKGLSFYNSKLDESIKTNNLAKKSVGELLNVKKALGEEVKKLSGRVKEMALGFVSGFAGGLVSQVLPVLLEFGAKLIGLSGKLSEFEERQKISIEIQDKAAEGYASQVTRLELIRMKLNDLSIPEKERIKLLNEYNSIADKGNKLDKAQIDNLAEINFKINEQISLIKQRALAKAAENVIAEKAEGVFKSQTALQEKIGFKLTDERISDIGRLGFDALLPQEQTKVRAQFNEDPLDLIEAAKNYVNKRAEFNRAVSVGLDFITTEGLTTKSGQKGVKEKKEKEIENVYVQMLNELKARLASARDRAFESEPLIFEKFATQLQRDFASIDKLIKDKKLTSGQGSVLKGLIDQINEVNLNKELTSFRKNSAAALQAIDDELSNVALQVATHTAQNIRDGFEREKATIEQTFQSTSAAIEKAQTSLLKKIDDDQEKGLISEGDAKRKKFLASVLFGNLLTEAGVAKTNQEIELAFKIFKKTLDAAKTPFEDQLLTLSQETTEEIKVQTARFFEGKIGYEKYQKALTDIIKKESRLRRKIALDEAEDQLLQVRSQLKKSNLTKAQRESLEDQVRALENQITNLNREILTGGASDQNAAAKKKMDALLSYVKAISDLANSVLSFWQKTNEAEQEALDKSITLQEKRVEAAQRIAARGNAQYLKEEQDRLTQLQVQRENAARKQLGIDSALQASQVLVGITGAISKIAAAPFGAETISEIAIIIGALATGYGIVRNLQGNQPRLAEGTKYLSRGNNPSGRDTIPAMLDEGEAVIPADKNKDYHPTISALFDGTIPADHLNNFVRTYHKIKSVPQPNYSRIGEVAAMQISSDGKMAVLLSENNKKLDEHISLQRQTIRTLKAMGMNVNLDKNGFAASWMEVVEQAQRDKKA